jgi:flagellar basal-body rod modification protein FlgD
MSTITPTTAGSATTAASGSTPSSSSANILGPDSFLKLMMAQLKAQDPLSPSDPTQYLSELAQFTSVEQMTQTSESASKMASEQGNVAALSLLGHSVTYTDPTGAQTSGSVQKVEFGSSGPSLTIDGVTGIDPSSVSEVS